MRDVRLRALPLLLLVALTGCGLDVYETKMAEEQERVNYLDEESRSLDVPIEYPEVKEGDKVLLKKNEVFFRPPRGVHRKAVETYPHRPYMNLYKGKSTFSDVYVSVGRGQTDDKFRKDVLARLGLPAVAVSKRPLEQRSERPPREVNLATLKSESPATGKTYFVNFYKDKDYHVAVAFELSSDQAGKSETTRLMDLSLATLAAGSRARSQHAAFRSSSAPPAPRAR